MLKRFGVLEIAVVILASDLTRTAWGTLYKQEINTATCWIEDQEFYKPFSGYEKQKYFYPRDGYLNRDGPVHFYVVDNRETRTLQQLCRKANNQVDFEWLEHFTNHSWRVEQEEAHVPFVYVPTFAGPVLDGECGPEGFTQLKKILREILHRPGFKDTRGHQYLHVVTSASVQELLLQDLVATIAEPVPEKHFDLKAIMSNNPPDSLVPYVLNQMVSAERFSRPTLQFCQVFRPEYSKAYVQNAGLTGAGDLSFEFDSFASSRPVEYGVVEELGQDPLDEKFKARRKAFEDLKDKNAIAIIVPTLDQEKTQVPSYDLCPENYLEQLESGTAFQCILRSRPEDLSELRQKVLLKSRFAIITRGRFPHENNLYDAVLANSIIINTIDKSIDMAMPFQCMVPWEEFTMRVGQAAFTTNPEAAMNEERRHYTKEQLGKMLRLQVYYRPDVLFEPGFNRANNVVENLMLTTLRRCSTAQITERRNFTGHYTKCPFTDWAKLNFLPRTMHNVDMAPWAQM